MPVLALCQDIVRRSA